MSPTYTEAVIALHVHTHFSDGSGTHADIARAALAAGLDAVIVTDHNVWVDGIERYYRQNGRRVLLLCGEEVHDTTREPQKNHTLVIGARREMAPYASEPQRLFDAVRKAGGMAFIAHPVDPAAPLVGEPDISWVEWDAKGYSGLEIWNALSEFKGHLKTPLHVLFYSLFFHQVAVAPYPEALQRWDALLAKGQRVVAVGGADAHALIRRRGPLRIVLFPYEKHFRAITTHLLLREPLDGRLEHDRGVIYEALEAGRAFVGYDLPAPTHGFRFTASGEDGEAVMGETLSLSSGVTLKIRLPRKAECRLIRHGEVVQRWAGRDVCTATVTHPGAYRVEVYLSAWGRRRGWIFSNPIYLTGSPL